MQLGAEMVKTFLLISCKMIGTGGRHRLATFSALNTACLSHQRHGVQRILSPAVLTMCDQVYSSGGLETDA